MYPRDFETPSSSSRRVLPLRLASLGYVLADSNSKEDASAMLPGKGRNSPRRKTTADETGVEIMRQTTTRGRKSVLGCRRREFRLFTTFCARIYYGPSPQPPPSSSILRSLPLTLYCTDTIRTCLHRRECKRVLYVFMHTFTRELTRVAVTTNLHERAFVRG